MTARRLGAWIGTVGWIAAGIAGADAPPRYSLDDCLARGRAASAAMDTARRQEEIAQSKIVQIRAQALPAFTINGRYTRQEEVVALTTPAGALPMGRLDNYTASLEASQLLWNGGAAQAAVRAAREFRESARRNTEAVEARVTRDIRIAFYDALLAQARSATAGESVCQLEAFAAQVDTRRAAGAASDFDLQSAQVRLANERSALIRARAETRLALARLRYAAHLPSGAFELNGALEFRPVRLAPGEARRLARARRPELLRQQIVVSLRREALRAERGGYQPELKLRGAYSGQNPESFVSSQDEWRWSWDAGVTLEWSLFDGGRRQGVVRERGLELLQAEADLDEAARGVDLDVEESALAWSAAAEAEAASRATVDLAEKNLELARTRYDAGVSTYLEFTDTNLALSLARLERQRALRDCLVAAAGLQYAAAADDAALYGADRP